MRKIKKDDVSAYEHNKKSHDYVHIIYELLINIEMRENKKRLDDRNIRSYGKKIVNYSQPSNYFHYYIYALTTEKK
jgi:hypothetical protein